MANLSQASIPAGFLKSAAQCGVAESDFLLLADLGMDTHEAFALRVHSREALEEFLLDVIYTLERLTGIQSSEAC